MGEGYKPKTSLYALEFAEFEGLEIYCRGTNLGKLLDIGRMENMNMQVVAQSAELQEELFGFFATRVARWNLLHPEVEPDPSKEPEDNPACPRCRLREGDPMPINKHSLYCLELEFVMKIIFGWVSAVARVADPKENSSSNGEMNSRMESLMSQLANLQSPLKSPTPS